MKVLKNKVEVFNITLQQYSTNNDILTFEFEKPLGFEIESSLAQIIYEVDKIDSIKNNNITIEEKDDTIIITWLVKENITLTKGDKKAQIVIKNDDRIYLSSVFIIKVLESLNVDSEIVETNLSYLEYWERRITEILEKVENFEGLDLTEYITKIEFETSLDNYFNKIEIQEKLDLKVDKIDLKSLATKQDLDNKLNIGDYNLDKDAFQLKIDSNLQTKNKTIVGSINELNNKVQATLKPNIIEGNGISIEDSTVNVKYDNKTIVLNEQGQLEAKLSIEEDEGNISIKQYVLKDVKSGILYTIKDETLPINHKLIPSIFVLENSNQNTETITNFKLSIEDVSSNKGIKIQDNYKLDVVRRETSIINKSSFNKILEFKGGFR